jgi:drug/metabolite transporter (DMT)-like permease
MFESIPYFGEIMALGSAAAWGVAVILFKKSGETVHPISLNLFKNILGFVLFFLTMLLFDQVRFSYGTTRDFIWLLISGALGIGISDTLFFKSLNLLGAGLYAIVNCLYSPFIILLSMLWLHERLTVWQIVGIVLILTAVLSVSTQKVSIGSSRVDLIKGLAYAVAALAIMAIGIVMVKPILEQAPLLWATEVRLLGGLIVLALVLALHPLRKPILSSLFNKKGWIYTLSGSFVGTYISFLAWMAGMKYTQASIVAPLNQTATLFIFIFAAWFLHERLTAHRVVGILIGLVGVLLMTWG